MVLLNLVAEQIKLGLEPTIASIGEKHIGEKPLETEARKRRFSTVKFRILPGPNPYGMLKVLHYAQKNEFDILHSHGYKGNVAFGLMPKRLRKLPLISTLHGWTSVSGFSKNRVYEWLDLISLKYIDAVVLVSEAMKSHSKFKGRKGINFHVIHNGIPIPAAQFNDSTNQPFNQSRTQTTNSSYLTIQPFDSLDKTIVEFCHGGFTIGSIGRLSTEKGYRYLIEALHLLSKRGLDVRLVIIGDGYERNFLEGLVADFELKDRVMLPGYLADAKNYLPYFNLFVLSSLTEGLPITLLEAMQAKVPIVSTEVGGIPEVLQNGRAGLLIQPYKPEALAESIGRLYHDPKLAENFASVSYQKAVTKYTSKTMALRYLDIYQKVTKPLPRLPRPPR